MLKIKPNPDKQKYEEMTEAVKKNNGYCPCLVERNEDTKCMCKPFREQKTEGPCYCGRFIKVEKLTVEPSRGSKDKIFEIYMNGKPIEEVTSTSLEISSESQWRISKVLDKMKDVLLYKNQKYGDSALHPNNVFFKGDSTNSILIRLDDKIGRIKNNPEEKPRINDVADIIGYCTLLLVSMDVSEEDLEKLKD